MQVVHSSFLVNQSGHVAIVFDDPNFVRSETIIFDRETGALHAVLHHQSHLVGQASGRILEALARQTRVTLSSTRIDGSQLDLVADLVVH
jgi:hypothetical protein